MSTSTTARRTHARSEHPILFFNTLSRSKEPFVPLRTDYVRMYNCGPTVYDRVHIGNLRAFVFADTVRRLLLVNGYRVRQVMNITDVGHLTSDADEGEDKMTVGLKREGLPLSLEGMRRLASTYANCFFEDMALLNIKRPTVMPRASDHVVADIALIATLMEKEYAYRTPDGVYFDTSKFREYGKLGKVNVAALQEGARVASTTTKRHPADFALWKKNDSLGWESPWGRGFPGWHIECSAMAMEHLGKELDIHTGGVDHIGTHHNNEIAQSEAATGRPFARYWLHNEFINVEGVKISKSLQNTISLKQLIEYRYAPLAYRYWLLTGHYRSPMTFTFTALDGAATALQRLHRVFVEQCGERTGRVSVHYRDQFLATINNDLDTPGAIALLWEVARDAALPPQTKRATLLYFDRVLGLGLTERTTQEDGAAVQLLAQTVQGDVPQGIQKLMEERQAARANKDWQRADEIREALHAQGYRVEDGPEGPHLTKLL